MNTPTQRDIWAELAEPLRRYVGRRVNDPHAADDVTQDVMLKVQARLASMPPGERVAAWVFGIARNAVVDHYRAQRARHHADVEDVGAAVADAEDDEREQRAVVGELAGCLRGMVDRLPGPYRDALTLADLEGVSQQEVAARLGISLSGAKSRVQRARQQLRGMLLACCTVERDARGQVIDYASRDGTCERPETEGGGGRRGRPAGGAAESSQRILRPSRGSSVFKDDGSRRSRPWTQTTCGERL